MADVIADLERRLPNDKVTADSVRERNRNVYSLSRNEGFFAKKVILVEGATEAAWLNGNRLKERRKKKEERNGLTLTGLLMEGVSANSC